MAEGYRDHLDYTAKSKIDLLPNNSSSFQGAARVAGVAGPFPVRSSSGPLVGELLEEITDQEIDGGWTHEDGSRTCASEPSWNSALVLGRPGVHPVSSVIGSVLPRPGSDPPLWSPLARRWWRRGDSNS